MATTERLNLYNVNRYISFPIPGPQYPCSYCGLYVTQLPCLYFQLDHVTYNYNIHTSQSHLGYLGEYQDRPALFLIKKYKINRKMFQFHSFNFADV